MSLVVSRNPRSLPRGTRLAPLLALGLAAMLGCGGGGGGASSDAAADAGGSASPDGAGDALVGSFNVSLIEATTTTAAHTKIIGTVADGPQPPLVDFVTTTTDGDCWLVTPHVPFCSTSCGGSAVCVADETCQAYPNAKDVGQVTVAGVASSSGASTLPLKLVAGNYQPDGVTLSYPPFDEGDDVAISATGSSYAAFSIHAKGIAPLALASGTMTLEKDQPTTLTWTAAGASADSMIHVKLDLSHHGGTKGQIVCDAPDSGSLTISAALMTQLLNLGVSGFPSIVVTRSSTGTTSTALGRVQLLVSQDVERYVEIPGLASCEGNRDCPMGQTCQDDLQCK